MTVAVKLRHLPEADPDIPLPAYETPGAAGADIRANFADRRSVTLAPGARALIPTGLQMEIPAGYEIQIRPRSGLALKHGVTLVNAPGTIDSDYRGAVGVIMINLGQDPFEVAHGARIAQMILAPVTIGTFALADTLSDTERGAGGFGSTGRR